MASPIRWLHLSDFHVGKDDYAGRKMFDYIFAHVKQRKEEGFTPDLLFITGDLANKGLKSEYEDLWLEFVSPLQELLGNNIAERTFVVPGNHDVDRDHNQAFGRKEMLSDSSRHFDPTEKGLKARQMLLPRFQSFNDNDLTACKGAFVNAAGAFSTMLTLGGTKVGIAGINTAWLCKDDHDERKLTPGKGMVEQALNSLKEAQLRIVVGHHPLDWLLPAEQKPIKSLFGQNAVIYLHGHLHEEWAEPTYGGGHQFLAIQSGAAFQAREREKWRNGLVWAEADLDVGELRLQARRWIPNQQAWVPVTEAFHENHRKGDWWHYPLPGSELAKKLAQSPASVVKPAPKGWSISKSSELAQHLVPIDEDAAVRFFNGAAPSWATALSTSIPRRKVVAALTARFQDAETATRPIVAVLLAAGCEGKTTALLQAAHQVVHDKPEWRILRRGDDAEPLQPTEILPLLSKEHRWLVVIDEADRVAKTVVEMLPRISSALQGRVHFLLACRDSDWLGSHANELKWSSVCDFQQERLAGLGMADAEAVVAAWASFGKLGLGDLASVPENKRAALLDEKAHEEAKTNQGAFFGALLAVRHGSDLPNHARLMLERLSLRQIPGGSTLRHALAFIAAMHSEGLEFLSRPVLAHALACPLARLHREVLVPLGQEAAATVTSSSIFTRHRRIADAIVSVLETDFATDVGCLFLTLSTAAIETYTNGITVPDLAAWRYRIAEHFFEKGRTELALDIAKAVLDREPDNAMTRTNVAKLFRKAAQPELAVAVFRNVPASAKLDRQFFYEWSTAEGNSGDHVASSVLAAFSLSDDCFGARVNNDNAMQALAGLGVSFGELFSKYSEIAFRDARVAVAILGQQLRLDERAARCFQNYIEAGIADGAAVPALEEAFVLFKQGVSAAESIGVNERVDSFVPDAAHLDFAGLQRLIYASIESGQR